MKSNNVLLPGQNSSPDWPNNERSLESLNELLGNDAIDDAEEVPEEVERIVSICVVDWKAIWKIFQGFANFVKIICPIQSSQI